MIPNYFPVLAHLQSQRRGASSCWSVCDGEDEEEKDKEDDDAHGAAAAIRVMMPPLLASLRRREAHAVHAHVRARTNTHTLSDDAQGVPSPTRNSHERTLTPSWLDAVWRTSTRQIRGSLCRSFFSLSFFLSARANCSLLCAFVPLFPPLGLVLKIQTKRTSVVCGEKNLPVLNRNTEEKTVNTPPLFVYYLLSFIMLINDNKQKHRGKDCEHTTINYNDNHYLLSFIILTAELVTNSLTSHKHVQEHLTPVAMPTICHSLDPFCRIQTCHEET